MRSPGRVLFQELGDGIEVEDGCALCGVSGQERARRRDGYEHGDGEPEPDEGEDSGPQDVVAGYDRSGEQQNSPGEGIRREGADEYSREKEDTCDCEDRDIPAADDGPVDLADPGPATGTGRARLTGGHGRPPYCR